MVKEIGGGVRTRKTVCLSRKGSARGEPDQEPAQNTNWNHSLFSKRSPYFILRLLFFNAKHFVPILRSVKCYIFKNPGKEGGGEGFEKWSQAPCWGILKCHPGLQKEKRKKEKEKTSYWSEGMLFLAKLSLNEYTTQPLKGGNTALNSEFLLSTQLIKNNRKFRIFWEEKGCNMRYFLHPNVCNLVTPVKATPSGQEGSSLCGKGCQFTSPRTMPQVSGLSAPWGLCGLVLWLVKTHFTFLPRNYRRIFPGKRKI